jgi:heterodisulfide reductase subunit A
MVKAVVNEAVCKGCGTCVVTCPVSAINIKHFPDNLIEEQFESILTKPDLTEKMEAIMPSVETP